MKFAQLKRATQNYIADKQTPINSTEVSVRDNSFQTLMKKSTLAIDEAKEKIVLGENNPNDLMTLIGDLQKDDFYKKLRERCEKNLEEKKDIALSKDQIVSVVVELKIPKITKQKQKYLDKIIQKTSFGDIILN